YLQEDDGRARLLDTQSRDEAEQGQGLRRESSAVGISAGRRSRYGRAAVRHAFGRVRADEAREQTAPAVAREADHRRQAHAPPASRSGRTDPAPRPEEG